LKGKRALDISDVKNDNGKIRPQFRCKDGTALTPNGQHDVFRDNGTLLLQVSYHYGTVHGPYVEFWSNGKIACIGQFDNGKQDGDWSFFRDDGSLMERISFREGKNLEPRG
jgi:antitoxin component YwqK of YwqJK toxin-antitoxin module